VSELLIRGVLAIESFKDLGRVFFVGRTQPPGLRFIRRCYISTSAGKPLLVDTFESALAIFFPEAAAGFLNNLSLRAFRWLLRGLLRLTRFL
jgi:hypothetical protein